MGMKNYTIVLFCLALCIGCTYFPTNSINPIKSEEHSTMVYDGENNFIRMNGKLNEKNPEVPIFFNEYTYIQRDLNIKDFMFIEKGMSIQELKSKLGEPNGTTGFGLMSIFYHLEDESVIVVLEDINSVHALQHCVWSEKDCKVVKKWILEP